MAKAPIQGGKPIDRTSFPMLALLSGVEQQRLQSEAVPMQVAADTVVVTEGQQPGFLYLLEKGLLTVSKCYHHETYDVGFITPGELFGEASILYDAAASAEVRSTGAARLFRVPAGTVRNIITSNQRFERAMSQLAERRMAATAMAVNPAFSRLPKAVRETILYNGRFVSFDVGDTLFRERQSDTHFMYLVLKGRAEATAASPDASRERIVVADLGAGDMIGESAVIRGRYAATVTATAPLRLLKINNEAIHAWVKRYPDFGDALRGAVQY